MGTAGLEKHKTPVQETLGIKIHGDHPETLQHYGIEGCKRSSELGSHHAEILLSVQTADVATVHPNNPTFPMACGISDHNISYTYLIGYEFLKTLSAMHLDINSHDATVFKPKLFYYFSVIKY